MLKQVISATLLMGLALPAGAQEREPGQPVAVHFVKFKPGSLDRISEIESKYFDPAADKVGIRPIIIRMASGDWDREYIFPMKSMGDLDYITTPENKAWLAEVDKLAGGPGSAQKLLAEWGGAIVRDKHDFGFSDQK